MAEALGMERGVLQYHLDRLDGAGLARTAGGNYLHGHTYIFTGTPISSRAHLLGTRTKGRQYVVEHNLIDPDTKAR
jgi:hypothetical protein